MQHGSAVEIRLLGPVLVRDGNGRVVPPTEWRTLKTLDLLRLLALTPGTPVDVERLVAELWPDVPEERARASLRTAAYQIRKVLGEGHIDRQVSGLALTEAWVDAEAFTIKAQAVDAAHRDRRYADAVRLTRQAESLYVGDLADQGGPPRLAQAAAELRSRRLTVLLQGAEAALELAWMRDAHDFAMAAHVLDPHAERAARALMRALAGLGEVEEALAVFEGLRRALRDDLGVDPAPQTRALHHQVLAGMASPSDSLDDVPGPVDDVVAALKRATEQGGLVVLEGEPHSGRGRIAAVAAAQLGLDICTVADDTAEPLSDNAARTHGRLLMLPALPELGAGRVAQLARLARSRGVVLILRVHRTAPEARELIESGPLPVELVTVRPLDGEQLAELTTVVLQGAPSAELLHELAERTGGLAGRVVPLLRSWLAHGDVIWTPDGLALREWGSTGELDADRALQRRLRSMRPELLDALCVVAVADVPITARELDVLLQRVHESHDHDAQQLLADLVDAGLLTLVPGGYRLQHAGHRHVLEAWMRPRTALRTHAAVADELDLTDLERARHLVAAGHHHDAARLAATALYAARARRDHGAVAAWRDILRTLPLPSARRPDDPPTTGGRRPRKGRLPVRAVLGLAPVHWLATAEWQPMLLERLALAL